MNKIISVLWLFAFVQAVQAQDSTDRKIDELISAYTQTGKFNGSALVARHGKILLEKGYGYRSIKDKSLNNSNTIFQIASVTKQFTSAVVLKLVELDKLSLTDKLSKYYPDFPKGDSISIENLLTHTSGIYEWTNNTVNFGPTDEQSLLAFLKKQKLDFPPGSSWSYSNSNYSLLGYIIQKITGMSYENAVRKYIFIPLHMTHSGFDFKHLKNRDKATGYSVFSDSVKTVGTLYDSVGPFAAGEIYSTVGDLYRWHEGLQDNKIISKASLEKAYRPLRNHYGYGWIIDSVFGKRLTTHSGDISGFSGNLARITEDDVFIILLNNKQGSGLEKITRNILAILYDQPYTVPVKRHAVILDESILRKYIGTYEVASPRGPVYGDVTIENGKLMLQARGRPKLELFAESEDHFYDVLEDNEGEVRFGLDDTGTVESIILSQNGTALTGKKIK